MRIAIFDYIVEPTNPIGSCHLRMIEALCSDHDITVFAREFRNPCPARVRWVRVPSIRRPLALLFCTYHVIAPLRYVWNLIVRGERYDLIQFVESNLLFGDISYAHFCHRVFLKQHWRYTGIRGARGVLRWLDHWLHAAVEPWVYKRVRRVIVPSLGLARELERAYPFVSGKVVVLPNSVDWEAFRPPAEHDREAIRKDLGLHHGDVVVLFVALGQFERKGLPLLLDAFSRLKDSRLRLVVVGGTPDLVASYRKGVATMDLKGSVSFVGMQQDVRPFFWSADAFALFSHYEAFPLVALQAAAAALPLMVSPLNGTEEFVHNGANGYLVTPNVDAIAECLKGLLSVGQERRRQLGQQARRDVERYDVEFFRQRCFTLYSKDLVRGST